MIACSLLPTSNIQSFTVLFVACRRRPPRSAAVGERSDRRGVRYELSGGGFLWERSQ